MSSGEKQLPRSLLEVGALQFITGSPEIPAGIASKRRYVGIPGHSIALGSISIYRDPCPLGPKQSLLWNPQGSWTLSTPSRDSSRDAWGPLILLVLEPLYTVNVRKEGEAS